MSEEQNKKQIILGSTKTWGCRNDVDSNGAVALIGVEDADGKYELAIELELSYKSPFPIELKPDGVYRFDVREDGRLSIWERVYDGASQKVPADEPGEGGA